MPASAAAAEPAATGEDGRLENDDELLLAHACEDSEPVRNGTPIQLEELSKGGIEALKVQGHIEPPFAIVTEQDLCSPHDEDLLQFKTVLEVRFTAHDAAIDKGDELILLLDDDTDIELDCKLYKNIDPLSPSHLACQKCAGALDATWARRQRVILGGASNQE